VRSLGPRVRHLHSLILTLVVKPETALGWGSEGHRVVPGSATDRANGAHGVAVRWVYGELPHAGVPPADYRARGRAG
jgi:hypothetical protein